MPKRNIVLIDIPVLQPDRCLDCPLLGLVPKEMLPKGSQETYVCMATQNALSARYARSRVSEGSIKHPRHRWCDDKWATWVSLPKQKFPLNRETYKAERLPLEARQQMNIHFHTGKYS